MTGRFPNHDGRARIALVTAVPSFVKSLTGINAGQLNRRAVHRIEITQEHTADFDLPLDQVCVDLFFLPAITGDYSLSSSSNVRDLAQRLAPYDMAIDLCEFCALYRRGRTTAAAFSEFHQAYGQGAHRGFLEYQNFLNVIEALNTTFDAIIGRAVFPETVTNQFYEWGLSRAGKLAITNMSHGETAPLNAPAQENMILDAVRAADRPAVRAALGMLDNNGMATLSSKVMFSGYLSDTASIQAAVLENTDPKYTFELEDIFDHRRAKYGCNRSVEDLTSAERRVLADINTSEERLKGHALQFSLVDYYRISGGPAEMRGKTGEDIESETKDRFMAFREKFEGSMAFARHWDTLEDSHNTKEMNDIVNGWSMTNSSYGILRDARAAGLAVQIKSLGVPTLMTNSIGLIPSAELHGNSVRSAVFGALGETIKLPIVA